VLPQLSRRAGAVGVGRARRERSDPSFEVAPLVGNDLSRAFCSSARVQCSLFSARFVRNRAATRSWRYERGRRSWSTQREGERDQPCALSLTTSSPGPATQLLDSAPLAPRTGSCDSRHRAPLPPRPSSSRRRRDDAHLERARAPAAEPDQPDLALRPAHASRVALARRGGRRAGRSPSQVREEEARRCGGVVRWARLDRPPTSSLWRPGTRRLRLCGQPRPRHRRARCASPPPPPPHLDAPEQPPADSLPRRTDTRLAALGSTSTARPDPDRRKSRHEQVARALLSTRPSTRPARPR